MKRRHRSAAIMMASVLVGGCAGAAQSTAPTSSAGSGQASPVASGSAAAADICTNPPRHDGRSVTVASFGGTYQDAVRQAWLTPYAELTGITWQESSESSDATVKAQVESGVVTWDLVDTGGSVGLDSRPDSKELFEPLDFSLIPEEEIADAPGFVTTYRVASQITAYVLAYNTEKTNGQAPSGWADFYDLQRFPGTRGMHDSSHRGVFETALIADGVSSDEVYPLDYDRAIAKWESIKGETVFYPSMAQGQEQIGSGAFTMALIANGRAWAAKHENNRPVEIQWKDGILVADYWVIPKGAPNKDVAMEFIAWATCANNNPNLATYIPYGPSNVNAEAPADVAPDLPSSHADEMFWKDEEWYAANITEATDRYQDWVTQ